MAELAGARAGVRLTRIRRRPPRPLRLLRAVAAWLLVGLAALVGYEALRAGGFKLRWEVEPVAPPAPVADDGAPRPRLAPPPRRADRLRPGGEAGASAAGPPVAATPSDPDRPGATTDPAGRGAVARIDFETFADGRPACTGCPVADEWAALGLRISFRSWSADSRRAYVLDARNFLPADASARALGPALDEARGLEVGVLRLDFPGRPRRVAFHLFGPDLIRHFEAVAWVGDRRLGPASMTRTIVGRYTPAGRGAFRQERVLVESPDGIDRISLDGWGPPGHVLLVDDLDIDP